MGLVRRLSRRYCEIQLGLFCNQWQLRSCLAYADRWGETSRTPAIILNVRVHLCFLWRVRPLFVASLPQFLPRRQGRTHQVRELWNVSPDLDYRLSHHLPPFLVSPSLPPRPPRATSKPTTGSLSIRVSTLPFNLFSGSKGHNANRESKLQENGFPFIMICERHELALGASCGSKAPATSLRWIL
jgi:hypothetical protein